MTELVGSVVSFRGEQPQGAPPRVGDLIYVSVSTYGGERHVLSARVTDSSIDENGTVTWTADVEKEEQA